jgi:histone-lysine N-methyltransferase SETMAR
MNSASYCEVLLTFWAAIHRKGLGLLVRWVLLHHDNARPPYSPSNSGESSRNPVGTFEHPLYSPNLAPSDFHLFGLLKNHLGGKCFANYKEAEMEVQKWPRQQSKDFYAAGFNTLVKR